MKRAPRIDEERQQLLEERCIIDHLVQNFPVNRDQAGVRDPAPAIRPLYHQLRKTWHAGNGGLPEF